MKNEILDTPFQNSFSDFLQKDEMAIWEGQPRFKTKFFEVFLGDRKALTLIASFFGFLVFLYFSFIFLIPLLMGILFSNFIIKIIALVIFLLILSPRILSLVKRKKTAYFITNRQIIFQLWQRGKKRIYHIPFSAIHDLVVQEEGKNYGVIFLAIKNPQGLQFDTYNLRSGERRHQPTLEMVENVGEVAEFIRQGIQNHPS